MNAAPDRSIMILKDLVAAYAQACAAEAEALKAARAELDVYHVALTAHEAASSARRMAEQALLAHAKSETS